MGNCAFSILAMKWDSVEALRLGKSSATGNLVRERSLIIGGGGGEPVKFHKGGPKNINPPSN